MKKSFGLYNPIDEREGCGVGFVASIDGKPRRDVVISAITALENVWHRGAVDADGLTGDGAGLMVQLPQRFFQDQVIKTGHKRPKDLIGVGQIFLPRTNMDAQEEARCIVETEILKFGYEIYGWRQVPVDITAVGKKARRTRPQFEQILINSCARDQDIFERDLYIIRRRIEKAIIKASISNFYICSFSSQSLVYKGLFLAEQISRFYPDLLDERFCSGFAIFHQRYSTNTFPRWWLAQPFRMLAHNGEINTLQGNLNWMKVHETRMAHPVLGDFVEEIKPVVFKGASDSAALDSVFELLCQTGRGAPMAKSMLIPEAFQNDETMPEAHKDLYGYCNSIIEPWDGPAAIAAFDGRWVIGGMDRNGLRPFRYSLTKDGLIIAGSETGLVSPTDENTIEKGRIGPGQMIAVDLHTGRFYKDREIKDKLAARRPYARWNKSCQWISELVGASARKNSESFLSRELLLRLQLARGYALEDMDLILKPMVEEGKEAIGSMGDDTPLAVLSNQYRGLHHYFRQNFSQVTNPPIDHLRESRVMNLHTRAGNLRNILEEDQSPCEILGFEIPVISNADFSAMSQYFKNKIITIDTTFDANGGKHALRKALERIRKEAENALKARTGELVLTDEGISRNRAAIPSILAAGAVHTHLVRKGLRGYTSLHVRSAECFDVHHFAVLIGVGATTVNPWLAEESILDGLKRGAFTGTDVVGAIDNYKKAVSDGLLKIMSKMGISIISSYRGGCNFEAIGLSRSLVAAYFPGIPSRISGIGLSGIQQKILNQHKKAFMHEGAAILPAGGFYRYRSHGGEQHAWEAKLIHLLQKATRENKYDLYKEYSDIYHSRPPVQLRDLLSCKSDKPEINLHDVESVTSIRKRFVTPGMSLGALSPEAHGTLNVAMNRIGAKSNSGEGGEDTARFKLSEDGSNWNSAIKQVASGRFGVSAEYLNQCREIEIKIAQGAKPGEGGQLPGFKVTEMIAKFRHATPGIMLISPPPHHDIYSIEDLAQLIYDLKQINSEAKVCVKLVARSGIGTIAAGVAKAHADVILVSGHVGGTGASPQSSIKFAGIPWEMGLSEVHQVLSMNGLRDRVVLRTDGGLRTGRDIMMAAMLGAEEYGIGTASLIAVGCLMVRQCHSNTCPVGVCTQDEALRRHFTGTPEKVVNLLTFMAEEVRENLAALGFDNLEAVVGRTDLLHQTSRGAAHLDDLDMNPILVQAVLPSNSVPYKSKKRNDVMDTLDVKIAANAKGLFKKREKLELSYHIRNTDRAVGSRLAALITKEFGMTGLPPGHFKLQLHGSAGQSLGAFAVQGMVLEVFGDANDYVGKGLSGATLIIRPPQNAAFEAAENTIIGNTVLYGAISGKLFAAGQAGERFAVRNSGALTVVEGCGANGCEYMTGGKAVILGPVGPNFAAGMTGGKAYVYDPEDDFENMVNPEYVWVGALNKNPEEEAVLYELIEEHVRETESALGKSLLDNWPVRKKDFRIIIPKQMAPQEATVSKMLIKT